jgi:ribosomal protein S13
MARLVGVDLPRDKRIEVALTYIFGVGRTRALQTLEATGISGDKRVHELATRSWSSSVTGSKATTRSKVTSVAR